MSGTVGIHCKSLGSLRSTTRQVRSTESRSTGRSFLKFDCFNNHLKLVLVTYK